MIKSYFSYLFNFLKFKLYKNIFHWHLRFISYLYAIFKVLVLQFQRNRSENITVERFPPFLRFEIRFFCNFYLAESRRNRNLNVIFKIFSPNSSFVYFSTRGECFEDEFTSFRLFDRSNGCGFFRKKEVIVVHGNSFRF